MQEPMKEYNALDEAFKFFNKELFNSDLPPLLITFRAGKAAHGYFSPNRLQISGGDNLVHELALNLNSNSRPVKEVLGTLVHEMVHLWQESYGSPSHNGYHNKEWAGKMQEIGLIPYNVASPDRMTGQKVSHTIQEGGPFDLMADQLILGGWQQTVCEQGETLLAVARRVQQRKHKYECEGCGNKVWGKASLVLICEECSNLTQDDLVLVYYQEV